MLECGNKSGNLRHNIDAGGEYPLGWRRRRPSTGAASSPNTQVNREGGPREMSGARRASPIDKYGVEATHAQDENAWRIYEDLHQARRKGFHSSTSDDIKYY